MGNAGLTNVSDAVRILLDLEYVKPFFHAWKGGEQS